MPDLAIGANSNTISAFPPDLLESWIDIANIPAAGPHTRRTTQYGCTINTDFFLPVSRSYFKNGMQGSLIEERDTKDGKKAKIFVQGVTEHWQDRLWITNVWVPASIVTKGAQWKPNIKDWTTKINLTGLNLNLRLSTVTSPDSSVLGKTIAKLLSAFHTSPAPFMSSKIPDLLDKRKWTLDTITTVIIRGIRDAGLYDTLNKPDFTIADILHAALHTIDVGYAPHTAGGIYMRYHKSSARLTHWLPNTTYAYIGKTVDFKERLTGHLSTTSRYGDLTRNSRLNMVALCVLDPALMLDMGYLAEQILICLFNSYREDLLVVRGDVLRTDSALEHADSVEAAHYFRTVSKAVFEETRFPGVVGRAGSGALHGANYSMPIQEWGVLKEQTLFIRRDTLVKTRDTGETITMVTFRTAKPKPATYYEGGPALVFSKRDRGKIIFSSFMHINEADGTTYPLPGTPYHVVFEVYLDGRPHPNAWSRLASIGPFLNWDQARSLALRIEWEFPLHSGKWRYQYIQSHKIFDFVAYNIPGSNTNYVKAIAFIEWLFGATPAHGKNWIPRLTGSAYVLQVDYDLHTQSICIKHQDPITMVSGAMRTPENIILDMKASDLGLHNIDGKFGQFPDAADKFISAKRRSCDTCSIIGRARLKFLGLDCTQIPGKRCCHVCVLFGRFCCSWTPITATKESTSFTPGLVSGTTKNDKLKITSDDLEHHKRLRAALVAQLQLRATKHGQSFVPSALDVVKLTDQFLEDDLSDTEDAVEDVGEIPNADDEGF